MKYALKTRYLAIFGAILLQICLGSLYSWSLFNAPLMETFGWSHHDVVMTYSIAISVFALTTIFSGRLQDKIGPKVVATIGGALYGTGLMLASKADSLPMLYLAYGIISGAGVGFAYVCPLSTCIKWFPNNKGLITGIIVGSFALGSLVAKYAIDALLLNYGLALTFFYLGLAYFVITLASAQCLNLPPQLKEPVAHTLTKTVNEQGGRDILKTPSFYLVWMMYFCGCLGGVLVIGLAADIGIELVGLDMARATSAVSIIALFNSAGRLLCGALSDRLGRTQMLMVMFLITALLMAGLSTLTMTITLFFICLAGIAFCFGGFKAIFPAILGDLYGTRHIGGNFGLIYQAYGAAALMGPVIISVTPDLQATFVVTAVVACAGLAMSFILATLTAKQAAATQYA